MPVANTHSLLFGYILWIFGFTGSHRFYYGRPVTGCIWFFTFGLFGLGWLIDVFLIPGMDRGADRKYGGGSGRVDFNLCWVLLVFFGPLGLHRFYMGKIFTGLLWLCTGGLFLIGYLFDMLTLNEQIVEANRG